MQTNIDRYKSDLTKIIAAGDVIAVTLGVEVLPGDTTQLPPGLTDVSKNHFKDNYQKWYSESYALIKQLLPDRLLEFECLYNGNGKRKKVDLTSYHILDWLKGITLIGDDCGPIVYRIFCTQLDILKSAQSRFESSLFDIKTLVQADLLDDEIESAKELLKCGFLRASGAICGVVLEKHLAQVCQNHGIAVSKKHPTISDLNELLKSSSVVDIPKWRQISRLGDLRNLCDHNKHREPATTEIDELISETDKLTKTLF
jgi:hypothetical protein